MTRAQPSADRVALAFQPMVDGALPLAQTCAAALREWGVETFLLPSFDLDPHLATADLRLVVTFGGDGTILRTARWLAGNAVPVVGVQMGRLGFLAELLPSELPGALRQYIDGDYWSDRRSMLRAVIVDPGAEASEAGAGGAGPEIRDFLALNDIVVGRGPSPRTVTIDLSMDGRPLHRFRCDGLIVSTATGSTAYSFAAGGPILAPGSPQLVVTAICPHISALRTLVLPAEAALRLQVWTSQPAVLTIDGQIDHVLANGQMVESRRSDCVTTFARRGSPLEFYGRILGKLDSAREAPGGSE